MIYSTGSKPSDRIKSLVPRLQHYNKKIHCVTSWNNIADALARLAKISASRKCCSDDEHVRMAALGSAPVALKIHETERVSAEE